MVQQAAQQLHEETGAHSELADQLLASETKIGRKANAEQKALLQEARSAANQLQTAQAILKQVSTQIEKCRGELQASQEAAARDLQSTLTALERKVLFQYK